MLPTQIPNQLRSVIQIPGVRYYVQYVQGQSSQSRIREYFYYIDHQGMLFLDDARIKNFTSCFKEKNFLVFFFNRLRRNETNRYAHDFPYLSLCGRERNYVRCDDLPIVFTHVFENNNNDNHEYKQDMFSYGYAGESLAFPFKPNKLCMSIQTGRVYHPASERIGGIGLVRSKLAIEFSNLFKFKNGENANPTHFTWKSIEYELNTEWYQNKISEN